MPDDHAPPSIERELEAWAAARRQAAGGVFQVPPDTRRQLHAEVGRSYGHDRSNATRAGSHFEMLWSRLIWAGAAAAALVLCAAVWWQVRTPDPAVLEVARIQQDTESKRAFPLGSPEAAPPNPEAAQRSNVAPSGADLARASRLAAAERVVVPLATEPAAAISDPPSAWSVKEVTNATLPRDALYGAPAGLNLAARTAVPIDPTATTPLETGAAPEPTATFRVATSPSQAGSDTGALGRVVDSARQDPAGVASVAMREEIPKGAEASPAPVARAPAAAAPATAGQAISTLPSTTVTSVTRFANRADNRGSADAAIAQQAFVRATKNEERPAKAPPGAETVLNRFQVEQEGDRLRFVDEDGSIYTGNVQAVQPAAAPQRQLRQTVRPARAEESAADLTFVASGTNRSLNQRVDLNGRFRPVQAQQSYSNQNVLTKLQGSYTNTLGAHLNNSIIEGELVLDGRQRIYLNAIPTGQ